MTVQAVIFKKQYWDLDKVHKWLSNHKMHPIKAIHETENFYRARMVKPTFRQYYTKKTSQKGVEFIIGY